MASGISATDDTTDGTEGQSSKSASRVLSRSLGSQELLMLPRQYSIYLNKPEAPAPFPQMNHVCVALLSATPPTASLKAAIDDALSAHPLLRAKVSGSGEPEKRIDLFQMVREGNPDPERFVAPPADAPELIGFGAEGILRVVDLSSDAELRSSWEARFREDLDDGSWCDTANGPLWKVELHRMASPDAPSALVFSFNHCISDQSSANLLLDQILANVAGELNTAVQAEMPLSLEESVLGIGNKWEDVKLDGMGLGTALYVAGKAAEGFRSPVIVPDEEREDTDGGAGFLGALSTISGRSAGGTDAGASARKSAVQFRTLSSDGTTSLLNKCRSEGVSVTNALTAAAALTATDFINGGQIKEEKERNYKVLQSLDMRRFGEQLDQLESVACMAGSMDLMLGPLPDLSGEGARVTTSAIPIFWDLAREGKKQTSAFVKSGGPGHATRVFDFAMSISDMNNLVHLTAESAASQGRAYSAGVSNVGVFERQRAVRREGDTDRGTLKSKHGKYGIEEIYFATPHSRSGCLYQVSSMTVNGKMMLTFHPAKPIVSEGTNKAFADAFIELLEASWK